jgi:hypothetical protein
MPEPDTLGTGSGWDAHPVEPPKQRRRQTADDAGSDHVVRRNRPLGVAGYEIDDVENDRRAQKAKREHDEHWMNRMPRELCSAFHI